MSNPHPHFTPLFRGVCTSGKLAALPDDTCRALYLLLLANADAWGRQDGRAPIVNGHVWPMLGRTVAETERCLGELESAGLIVRYPTADSGVALAIPDWEEKAGRVGHRSHRRPSEYPDPPASAPIRPQVPSRARTPEPEPKPDTKPETEPEPKPDTLPPAQAPGGVGRTGSPGRGKAGRKPSEPKGPRKDPSGPHNELARWWQGAWLVARGVEYAMQPKDFAAASKLVGLDGVTVEEIQRRAEIMLSSQDPWTADNASLSILLSQWNRFARPSAQRGASVAQPREPKAFAGIREYARQAGLSPSDFGIGGNDERQVEIEKIA